MCPHDRPWMTAPELARAIDQQTGDHFDLREATARLIARRREFGITRIGSLTGLDTTGVPVVQTVRPLSLSVSVSQGKGLDYQQATISSLMESIEGWASEYVADDRKIVRSVSQMIRLEATRSIFPELTTEHEIEIPWVEGWDMLRQKVSAVPLGLVDTAYVVPSAHPNWMERNTTGLAASTTPQRALVHACLEVLERHARSLAMKTPHFFDRYQVRTSSVTEGKSASLITALADAGFEVGIWSVPSGRGTYTFWCQIMEGGERPFAPLPASGFGCDVTTDKALTKALLEACQSRVGFISSAREDVTLKFYDDVDYGRLRDWRRSFGYGRKPYQASQARDLSDDERLRVALGALSEMGASAVIAISLYVDQSLPLYVMRVVAPELLSNPETADGD